MATGIAPASISRCATVAFMVGAGPISTLVPQVVGTPAISTMSLKATGNPRSVGAESTASSLKEMVEITALKSCCAWVRRSEIEGMAGRIPFHDGSYRLRGDLLLSRVQLVSSEELKLCHTLKPWRSSPTKSRLET